jgi:mannan endo-1,4-beta-mannosidase
VLRVWLDGQSQGSTKGTSPFRGYPDLEPNVVGTYDDTVLNLLDGVMLTAYKYGIKLMISMHSFNALSGGDVYGRRWGTGYFYSQSDAIAAFDNRLRHVLNHQHSTLGKPWKSLSQFIFAFEAQNEAMIGNGPGYIASHQYWQCDRATTIKSELGSNSGILVTTGGESWLDESLQPDWFSCPALDIIAIHAYGLPGDLTTSRLLPYVSKAVASGKRLIVQEWGACYYSTSNNDCPQGSPLNQATRDQVTTHT